MQNSTIVKLIEKHAEIVCKSEEVKRMVKEKIQQEQKKLLERSKKDTQ